jgi:hypothetical protein
MRSMLLLLLAAAPAAAEPSPRTAITADVAHFHDDIFGTKIGGADQVQRAVVAGEVRVAGDLWLAASYGAALGEYSGVETGNPIVGARLERAVGAHRLRVGLDVALPIANADDEGGRDQGNVADLALAATTRGYWDAWRWFPGWATVAAPVQWRFPVAWGEVIIEGAAGVTFDASGDRADASAALVAQLGAELRRPVGATSVLEGRLAGGAVRGNGEIDGNGVVELGMAFPRGDVDFLLRAAVPFDSDDDEHPIGLGLLFGARWEAP